MTPKKIFTLSVPYTEEIETKITEYCIENWLNIKDFCELLWTKTNNFYQWRYRKVIGIKSIKKLEALWIL